MLKIGLTGGIGCGKSVVTDLFRRKGIEIIDADVIAHRLVEPGKCGLQKIVTQFGTGVLDSHGTLNRAALRELVFNSPQKRKELEAILHPLVFQCIESEINRLSGPYCVVCVPLLIETACTDRFDRILVIDCPVELQYQRVRERDGLDDDQIARILQSQSSREEKLSAADDVVRNDADLGSLDKQIEKLHNFYLELTESTGQLN